MTDARDTARDAVEAEAPDTMADAVFDLLWEAGRVLLLLVSFGLLFGLLFDGGGFDGGGFDGEGCDT